MSDTHDDYDCDDESGWCRAARRGAVAWRGAAASHLPSSANNKRTAPLYYEYEALALAYTE